MTLRIRYPSIADENCLPNGTLSSLTRQKLEINDISLINQLGELKEHSSWTSGHAQKSNENGESLI